MKITAQDVNKLRKMTGAGMMDCKKALTEADGDFEAAIDLLRKKGQKVSASRADRKASEGAIFVKTDANGHEGVLIALNCETDFVARNEEFQALGVEILEQAASQNPGSIDELMALSSGDLTLGEKVIGLIGKIGEKIEISAYERLEADKVITYIHAGSKLGVLVALEGSNGLDVDIAGRDVAMQIAAMNPVAVDKDQVDSTIVEREIAIGREQAIAQGKPENIVDKIAAGKLNKFFKENTLLNQTFVKDNSLTVSRYLESVKQGLTVKDFRRVSIGG
jgi:elongation factor Ts